ncbi:hypothetical protein HPB48_014115 [Haemaphysalis longicornis]|uniref:U4/U6.U5 small nuclear ribonucleoprotein 27 kDa protein n=1 Tax=Haemaphysalis longicornis TaxID=44386 RepID=A0A9J6FJU1_HAELO|nr:hypothetical protein HPB48_014115 [Haemaphysalis longicornis]
MALGTFRGTVIPIESATDFQENDIGAGPDLCLLDFATVHQGADREAGTFFLHLLRGPRERKEKVETPGALPKFLLDRPPITDKDLEGKTEEEQEMMKLMGFGSFDSSKVPVFALLMDGKHIPGNNVGAVHVIQKRKYRQYMNRKGGFNRPLDFVT